jgi:hypothetical protein
MGQPPTSEASRFQALIRKIVRVPKKEADEKAAEQQRAKKSRRKSA